MFLGFIPLNLWLSVLTLVMSSPAPLVRTASTDLQCKGLNHTQATFSGHRISSVEKQTL